MKHKMINIISLGSLLISSSIAVNAKTIDSHVHGLSEMTIAIEDKTLEIEITSPAMNLVGFEHKAHDKADIDIVEKITKQLNNHKELFSFSGGVCALVDSSTDTSSIMNVSKVEEKHHELNEHDNDEHDDHKSHHNENDHDDDEHEDHKSHHNETAHEHDEHSKQSTHYEIISYYHYDCKKASTLTAITVRMFDQFSGVDQITAKWLTETQQGSVILSPTKQIIKLR